MLGSLPKLFAARTGFRISACLHYSIHAILNNDDIDFWYDDIFLVLTPLWNTREAFSLREAANTLPADWVVRSFFSSYNTEVSQWLVSRGAD